jgi:hypothetical protein
MRRWSCSTTLLRYGQVRIWTAPSHRIEFVIHTHAAQGGMGWFQAVEGNHTRIAVTTKRSTEEGFGGGHVARSTEVGFDGFALFMDGAVEVHPLTAYLEVGLIYAPGIANRPLVSLPRFFEFRSVAYVQRRTVQGATSTPSSRTNSAKFR